jgi:hypothetical protein
MLPSVTPVNGNYRYWIGAVLGSYIEIETQEDRGFVVPQDSPTDRLNRFAADDEYEAGVTH